MSGDHLHLHDSGAHLHNHKEGHHAKRWERRFELPVTQGIEQSPDLTFLLRLSINRIKEERQHASNPKS